MLLGQYTMASQEKCQNPYEIELPQSIINSFARFLVPEIQKFYASEQGQKELEEWKRSILIKARSDVKFNDDMQKDALVWGILFCRSTGEECFAQRAFRLFLETRKNLIHLAAPHLLRLFCGRITLIIAEIQSLLKFIRTNYFKNFICQ